MGDNTLNYYYAQYNRPPRQYKGFDLLQIGTAYCKPQTEVAEHAHDKYFELTAVLSGEGVIFTNNVSVPVSKGDIFVSFPYDTHAIKAGQMGMDYNFVSFYLKDELLLSEFERLAIMYGKPCDRVVRSETLGTLIAGAISLSSSLRTKKKSPLVAQRFGISPSLILCALVTMRLFSD